MPGFSRPLLTISTPAYDGKKNLYSPARYGFASEEV
jgi:hypothetical protein